MIQTVVEWGNGLKWLDVCAPTPEELLSLAKDYGLHPTSVRDMLDPSHLPKFEKLANRRLVILRSLDERALKQAENDTLLELTRKTALFFDEKTLLTVHRKEMELLARARRRWAEKKEPEESLYPIVLDLFRESILSFDPALAVADEAFEDFEVKIFNNLASDLVLEEMYFLKRRVAVYRRVLRHTLDLVPKLAEGPAPLQPFVQDIKEEAERLYGWAEDESEDATALLSSHISLASHRTNEIVRVLTIFSVFFMPLTFIVGIYGMNFHHMPELNWIYGYPAVMTLMAAVALGLYMWFRKKGWLA